MKRTKRLLAAAVAAVMCVSMAACAADGPNVGEVITTAAGAANPVPAVPAVDWQDCGADLAKAASIAGFRFEPLVRDFSVRAAEGVIEVKYPLSDGRYVAVRKGLEGMNYTDIAIDGLEDKEVTFDNGVTMEAKCDGDVIKSAVLGAESGIFTIICDGGISEDELSGVYDVIANAEMTMINESFYSSIEFTNCNKDAVLAEEIAYFPFNLGTVMEDYELLATNLIIEARYSVGDKQMVIRKSSVYNSDFSGSGVTYPLTIATLDNGVEYCKRENDGLIYVATMSGESGYFTIYCEQGMTVAEVEEAYNVIAAVESAAKKETMMLVPSIIDDPLSMAPLDVLKPAMEVYKRFAVFSYPVDYDRPSKIDGYDWDFYKLSNEAIDTPEEMREYLGYYFTDEIIDELLGENSNYKVGEDGYLYSADGGRGIDPDYMGESCEVIDNTDDHLSYEVVAKYENAETGEGYVEVYTFEMVKLEDGRWVFSVFPFYL